MERKQEHMAIPERPDKVVKKKGYNIGYNLLIIIGLFVVLMWIAYR